MDDLDTMIDAVGPRLRDLRARRRLTLADVATTTGISVSKLSRLESGLRRPTLELLIPLAAAYQVQLDELVGSPQTGDPRIHAKPIQRYGMTLIALSRRPGGIQAYKFVVPVGFPRQSAQAEQQSHEGYEWLYVLDGELRLFLGDQDLILKAGEAAEFDTRTPHRWSNPGRQPTELLILMGPQGERAHVRARPTTGGDR